MGNKVKYFYGIFLAFFLTATSCIEDITNLDQGVEFSPYYSLPIGQNSIDMEMIFEAPGFDRILVTDSSFVDSLFFYEDNSYELTEKNKSFDTTLYQEVDFSFLDQIIENAVSVSFRIYIENAIPSEMTFQADLIDGNNSLVYSLVPSPGLVVPASIDGSISTLTYDTDLLTGTEIKKIPDIKTIQLYYGVKIQSAETDVTYFSDQDFLVELGIKVGLLVDISD